MHSNIIALQSSYEDPSYKPLLDFLRTQTTRSETTVEDVLQAMAEKDPDQNWQRAEVVECFKEFDELKFARMIKGAKSKKTRLEWLLPPRLVADAAAGNTAELEALMDGQTDTSEVAVSSAFAGKSDWTLTDLTDLISGIAGIPQDQVKIILTIPEARRILAAGQDISEEEVLIRLG